MTREEIMAMKPGRKLDALVAEKIMGLRVVAHDWPCGRDPEFGDYEAASFWEEEMEERGPVYVPEDGSWPPKYLLDVKAHYAYVEPVPFYSTDIAAAWQVVEKMITDKGLFCLTIDDESDGFWCHFGNCAHEAYGTAPEAICKAALLVAEEVAA